MPSHAGRQKGAEDVLKIRHDAPLS
ncbi:protein of unknown function (plasmid) [Azospirillum baldaniorum]|uniref:Uncharacterized protein n=1 Tax=Azospirillum baldaniorum TaxID=1064539 RepID=A0A9P1JYE7_9PROT|nr:protein of unknown function [Azospirillum baldaniorum]